MNERLQKVIARTGFCSRRKAEEFIRQQKVKVNGKIATIGQKVDADRDIIMVGKKRLTMPDKMYYLLLNKPRGYLCTLDDPQNRHLVGELVTGIQTRLFPVGRLDYNSEGLLIMTNDGDFAQRVLHPSNHLARVYHVKIQGKVTEDELLPLLQGVEESGELLQAKGVDVANYTAQNTWVEVTLTQGKTRQIRRMWDVLGRSVLKLKRIRFGTLELGRLGSGKFRNLTWDERKELLASADL